MAPPVAWGYCGYQHLWVKQKSGDLADGCRLTWSLDGRRYAATFGPGGVPYSLLVAELGANDPNNNLRHESCWLLRAEGAADHTFTTVVESLGPTDEARVGSVRVFAQTGNATGVLVDAAGYQLRWLVAHGSVDPAGSHRLVAEGGTWEWAGPVDLHVQPQ